MRNYWSCSKFADWIRGTKKLNAGTGEEWEEWTNEAKTKHPRRYWISEELLDDIQAFITWPVRKLYDIKYYILNRWESKSHAMTAHKSDVKPGEWCDVGYRILPCLFNELVDFVEIELAWSWIAWNPEEHKKFKAPWYATGWFRIRTWRSKEAGLANLKWQSELTEKDEITLQGKQAIEILALYTWWTVDRKERPDAYDASGWTEYCDEKFSVTGRRFPGQSTDESRALLEKLRKIEEEYETEDEEMMVRFIKIRHALWT